jgi:hypothetical protein
MMRTRRARFAHARATFLARLLRTFMGRITWGLLALLVVACGGAPAEDTLTVRSNTQARVGAVQIGAGNIWEDGGALTAGLWIDGRHQRVHRGETVRAAGLTLRVVEVKADAVVLALARAER